MFLYHYLMYLHLSKFFRYFFIIFSCIFVFLIPNTSTALTPHNVLSAIRKTEEHIQKNLEKKQIPGCAIAVVYRNQVIFLNGYGSRTLGQPEKIDANTVFQLGS